MAEERGIHSRTAAYMIAINRVMHSMKLRGWLCEKNDVITDNNDTLIIRSNSYGGASRFDGEVREAKRKPSGTALKNDFY